MSIATKAVNVKQLKWSFLRLKYLAYSLLPCFEAINPLVRDLSFKVFKSF